MTGSDDRWASGRDYESYIGRWSRLVAPLFLDWLGVPTGADWLDVGCGTGALTGAILDRCAPRSVVGVDPSEAFVAHAGAAVTDPRATFRVGHAGSTGLADAAVDAVVSGLVLNFVPELGAAFDEARRVTRPGGTVAGYVWDYADGMELLRRFWDAAVALAPSAAGVDEGIRFPAAARGPLAAAFTAAGFAGVETRAIEVPTVFEDFDDLWAPFLRGTGPAPTYVARLTPPARDALRERVRATVEPDRNGAIRLTARAWAVRGRRPA